MSDDSLGHPIDRLIPAHRTGEDFERTVGALAEEDLLFSAPFDLASSAALGRNTTNGTPATRQFQQARRTMTRHFRLQLHEVVPGADVDPREIVDTTQPELLPLLAVVQGLIEEMTIHDKEHNGGT